MNVVSTEFVALAHAQARALGHPDLPLTIVPHPFGILARADVRQVAEQCAEQVARLAGGATPRPAPA